jgi:serine phosphatase RsbU (regulator of sigma subunit)
VADVAGKGLGASLIMASVKAVLPFVARESAVRAMTMLNEKLVADLGRREFVALAFARLRASDGSVELLNAGFPDPYVVGPRGVRALSAPGIRLPLGVKRDVVYDALTARLAAGERLVFVSDGIPEAPSAGEPLGYERLATILAAMDGTLHAEPWLDDFLSHVRAQVDEGLDDDWTAVVVERSA